MANKAPSVTQKQDFFSKLPNSRQHIIALVILFLIPFVLFTATTIGGKEFNRHDIMQWRAGAESIIEYREQYNKEPLWATNMFAGMPSFVVSTKSGVPHLDLLSRIFKNIYPAFQYWVLLSGMYFLLVLMRFRSLSSVFGSLIYGLTTYFTVIIVAGHTSKLAALAFIPWLIAGYWLLTRSEKKIPGLLLFCVALALELRAGHPQITYYFFYLLGILWVFDTVKAVQDNNLKSWAYATGLLVIGGVIGIMGNADKLLTLQEYSAFSTRGGSAIDATSGLGNDYAFLWSQGISETLTLIVPDLFGGASPDYWGPKPVTSGPHYIGALCLLFVLIALFRQRSKMMYAFFATGTLGILFAWGGNFLWFNQFAFDYIPFFNKFRAPETWLVLTAFCYAVVSVYGLDWLIDYIKSKSPDLKNLYLPVGASAVIAVLLFLQVNSMDFTREGEVQNIANQIAQQNQVNPNNPQVAQRAQQYVNTNLVPARKEKAKSDVLRFTIILVLGSGFIYLLIGQKIPASAGLLGFVLIAGYDMISVDKRYVPEQAIVAGNVDSERMILSQRRDIDTYIEDNIVSDSGYPYRVFPLLDNPFNNAVPAYFYPSIGGYTGAKLSITQDVIDQNGPLYKGNYGLNLSLLSMLNVKYITYRQGLALPGLEVAYQGQQGIVYENTNVLPKAFFVDSVITTQDPAEAFNYLNPGQINFAETAVVETAESVTSETDSTSTVEVTNYTGPEITLETNRNTPGFLVLSEVYYPAGWFATLDGEEIPIYKTNYMLRGMEIPAGEHTVELYFKPGSYSLGVTLAWISLGLQLLLGVFAGFIFFTNRKEEKGNV